VSFSFPTRMSAFSSWPYLLAKQSNANAKGL
jgi:hypothetical protein